jgi:hypothetical protein
MATSLPANPLLALEPPFDFAAVQAAHVLPAIRELTERGAAALDAIAAHDGPPTYDSTLGALERATFALEKASLICEHLESAATTPELRAAWSEAQPLVSAFWSKVPLHDGLYRALRAFSTSGEVASLSPIQRRHLDKTLDEFRRHGAELPPEGKQRLTELDVELARVTTTRPTRSTWSSRTRPAFRGCRPSRRTRRGRAPSRRASPATASRSTPRASSPPSPTWRTARSESSSTGPTTSARRVARSTTGSWCGRSSSSDAIARRSSATPPSPIS